MAICDSDPDWQKLQRNMLKVGQREGLSNGRDTNFQSSFDNGYKDGFQNGFLLGKLNFQKDNSSKKISAEVGNNLENPRMGLCVICNTEKDNENVADVRIKQKKLIDAYMEHSS